MNYQYLILTQEGSILQSNESLFFKKEVNTQHASDFITFYKNIFPYIIRELKNNNTITFKAVNKLAEILPGIYDVIFSLKENKLDLSSPLIECWVIDRTEFYKDSQQFIQLRRDEEMKNLESVLVN